MHVVHIRRPMCRYSYWIYFWDERGQEREGERGIEEGREGKGERGIEREREREREREK